MHGRLPLIANFLCFLAALAACSAVGCGAPKHEYQPPPVGGLILWQDGTEPRELEGSSVEFEANGKLVAQAALTADGTFRLDSALAPGKYRVRVVPSPGKPSLLDPRHENFATSEMSFTATSEPQQLNFRVKKRGR